MRILQVITSLYTGGAEKLIVDLVPLYKEQGYDVDILLFDGTETPFKKQLQEKGVRIYHLGIGGSVYNPLFVLKLIPFLKHYDIVHTHNTACQFFVALTKYLFYRKVKLITTEHSTNNRRRNIVWFYSIDKFMYNQYDTIISISNLTADLLEQYLGISYPIKTIENGVNISIFQQAEPLDRNILYSTSLLCMITMVAGFRKEKDQDTLIRAMVFLPPEYKLCLVGDGERRKICENLVKKLGLVDRVVFTGVRTDISQVLKTSDIIVMSSYYEGLSLSSIEGMSVGKPFIASDVNGLREIVEGAGILFPQGNAEILAIIIKKLMNDKEYYRIVADQCMQRASEYDIRKMVNAYLEEYKKLI